MKLFLLIVFVFALGACSDTDGGLHAITYEEDEYDFSFVDAYIEDRQIIFLGESTHISREFTTVKAALVKYLHEQHDYTTLAMESGKNEIDYLNHYWDEYDDQFMLEQMVHFGWHTPEMKDLIGYAGNTSLNIRGLDPLPVVVNERRIERMGFQQLLKSRIENVNEDLANEFIEIEGTFLPYMNALPFEHEQKADLGEAQEMKADYESLLAELQETEADDDVLRFIEGRIAVLEDFTPDFLADYDIEGVYQDYFSRRDLAMFNELDALLEENPDEKIIVWGHNAHIQKQAELIEQTDEGNRMLYYPPPLVLGTLAHEAYGEAAYYVGLYFNQGELLLGGGMDRIEPKQSTDELEFILSGYEQEKLFVDFNNYDGEWMTDTLTAHENGHWDYGLVPEEQYDAIIFIEEVTDYRRR
ncbi:erythromycin esterase family protein [Alteribacter natronophilus]|uniref:erythromycin esterase family protein n=1 Tax=Alteribacter natronophilus TaxID=2583810 RepID=UPI001485E07E|nr:erythromycin esterase family protein [Alteribacter natronophilus]